MNISIAIFSTSQPLHAGSRGGGDQTGIPADS